MTATNGTAHTNGIPKSDIQRFEEIVANAMLSRQALIRQLMDPRRDIGDECGHPISISVDMYQSLYERDPIAARVVEGLPRECWKVNPQVYEEEDSDKATEFEQAWDELGKNLGGEEGYYKDEEGSRVWEYLKRADELSGIGHFGIILLGLDDGKDYREPATGKKNKLLFLRVFPESLVQISQFENDHTSPRYSKPLTYNVTLQDYRQDPQHASQGLDVSTVAVHWSRVVHVADNLASSEIYGVPRMRPVWNRLHDLQKLYGGSAEMYWRGAFPGMSIESPQGDVQLDRGAMRDQMENYYNGLQRYLALMGMTAKMLAPTVVDPTPQIMVHLEAICIKLEFPKRIFIGSERGELASSQDAIAWDNRLRNRQKNYLSPRLIAPFIDRLINLGCLPKPEQVCIHWPDLTTLSDNEKADVATKKTAALAQYVSGGVDAVIPPLDYLTRILDFDEEEAESILEAAAEQMEEKEEEEMVKQEEMIERGLAPNPQPETEEPVYEEPVE